MQTLPHFGAIFGEKVSQNKDPANEEIALENPALVSIYEAYINAVDEVIEKSIATHGASNILFVDMHGFKKQPDYAPSEGFDLILGTANRRTVLHGDIDQDFAFAMQNLGYRVFLPQKSCVRSKKADDYDAGHTTRYISGKFGINAIQIEISPLFRYDEDRGRALASHVSCVISRLTNRSVPKP